MGRPKNYVDKIANINLEIEATEMKLRNLYEERDELQKEMELNEVQNIYRAMEDAGITVEQLFASVQKPKRPYTRRVKTENKTVEA